MQESTLVPTSSLSLLDSPIVNCFPTAPTSIAGVLSTGLSLARSSLRFTGRGLQSGPGRPGRSPGLFCSQLREGGIDALLFRNPFCSQWPDTIYATDPAATSPVDRWRASPHSGYRSIPSRDSGGRSIPDAPCRLRCSIGYSSSALPPPPPQKKQL